MATNEIKKQSGVTSGNSASFDTTMSALDTGQSWFSGTPYSSYISQMISAGESLESGATGLIKNETTAWSDLSKQVNQITQLNPGASRTEALDINTSLKNSLGDFADSTLQNRELLRENTRSFYEGVGDLISDESFAQTAGNKIWYELDGSNKEKYLQMNDILDNIGQNKYLDVFFSDRQLQNRDANEVISMAENESVKGNGLFSDDWVDSFTNDAYEKVDRKYNRGILGTTLFGSSDWSGGFLNDAGNVVGHLLNFFVWEPLKFMTFDLANNTAQFTGSVFDWIFSDGEVNFEAGIGAALGAISWIPFVRGGRVASSMIESEAIAEVEALGSSAVSHITTDGLNLLTDAAIVGDTTFSNIESHLGDFQKTVNESFKKSGSIQSIERKGSFGKTAKRATREAELEREALDAILAPNGRTKKGLQKQGKTTLDSKLHKESLIKTLSMPSAELETKIATYYGDAFAKEVTTAISKLKTDFAKEITTNKKLLNTLMNDGTFGKVFNLKTLTNSTSGRSKKVFSKMDRTQTWKANEAERLYGKGTKKISKDALANNPGNSFSVLSKKNKVWKDVSSGITKETKYSDALLNKLYDNPAVIESKLSTTLVDNSARYTSMNELHTAEKAVNDLEKTATGKGAKVEQQVVNKEEEIINEVKQSKWGKLTSMFSKSKDKRAIKKGEKLTPTRSKLDELRSLNMDKMKARTGYLGRNRIGLRKPFGKRSLIPFKNAASTSNILYGGLTMNVTNQFINWVQLVSQEGGLKEIDNGRLWLDYLDGYDLASEWEWGSDDVPYKKTTQPVETPTTNQNSSPTVKFNLKF